ncbi:hypothetical protein P7K49_022135 [Saguinus oedipus]|uniref:Uncharacterized protein n=1 Tax=Saguinus oedipus TaxID=9490 RepID=A0ABQ9UUN3_SAGOE|nr:hypothetical protein P7K49_022135 [Saguinus oedipus]
MPTANPAKVPSSQLFQVLSRPEVTTPTGSDVTVESRSSTPGLRRQLLRAVAEPTDTGFVSQQGTRPEALNYPQDREAQHSKTSSHDREEPEQDRGARLLRKLLSALLNAFSEYRSLIKVKSQSFLLSMNRSLSSLRKAEEEKIKECH